jgi:predicted DNA repair protein MutK
VEKIYHVLLHKSHEKPAAETVMDDAKLLRAEKGKIKSAVRTDFILSIEIVMIALGAVIEQQFLLQVVVVSLIALLATVGVYGLVALIVRMDDMGFYLTSRSNQKRGVYYYLLGRVGSLLIVSLPYVIRTLGVIGTIAMLMVGGGMFTHNIPAVHHAFAFIPSILATLICGLLVGSVLVGIQLLYQRLSGGMSPS